MAAELDQFKAKFLRLLELRENRDRTATEAQKAERDYREYESELYQELEDAGIRGRLEFDFGPDVGKAKFQRAASTYGRVVDKFTAIKSLRAAGLGHIISEAKFEGGRLNELVRDRLESKQDLPDGIDYYHKKRISISRK